MPVVSKRTWIGRIEVLNPAASTPASKQASKEARPNTNDKSAKVVDAKQTRQELLVVFSRNAKELAPIAGARHRTWGKFSAFAALHFQGDWKAAKEFAELKGYGS